jgi:hypothetical protein
MRHTMFVRAKKVKGRVYFQLVQGYRDEAGRVRHRTITSLGTCPTLEDAIKVTKRELSGIRRQRGRYPHGVDCCHSKTLAAKIARLDRQEAAAVARLELLESALTQREVLAKIVLLELVAEELAGESTE